MRRLIITAGMLLGLLAELSFGGDVSTPAAPPAPTVATSPNAMSALRDLVDLEFDDDPAADDSTVRARQFYVPHDPWKFDVEPLSLTAESKPQVIPLLAEEPVVAPPGRFSAPTPPIPWSMIDTGPALSPVVVWGQQAWSGAATGVRDWTKRFTLGLRYVTGNSDEKTANVQADFERISNSNTTQFQFGGQFGESNGVRGSNRWFATSTHDFNTPSHWIYFLKHMDEYDEFQNLDYRGTFSGGLGYRFYNEDKRRLITRLGPAGTFEFFHAPSNSRQTLDLFGELEFRWPLTKRMQFEQKTTMYPNVENFNLFRTNTTANLIIALDERECWALQFGVQDQYISKPNTDRGPHDLWTNVSIVYQKK